MVRQRNDKPKSQHKIRDETMIGRVNQHDIARITGLAQKTVSRALRGEGGIKEQTRKKVLETAAQFGYRPNKIAQSLLGGKTGLVGFLITGGHGEYNSNLFRGIKDELAKNGYQMIVSPRYNNPDVDNEEVEALLQYNVEGLLVIPRIVVPYKKSIYKRLADEGVPLVMVDSSYGDRRAVKVECDLYSGMCEVMNYLIDRGHKQIGMIGALVDKLYGENERGNAYLDVLKQRLPKALRLDHYYGAMDRGLVRMSIDRFFSEAPNLTAIVCNSDTLALSFQNELEAKGLRVGKDISLVGQKDELSHPELLRVPLTTLAQDGLAVGRESASALIDLIAGRNGRRHRKIPTHLIERESVADLS